MTPRLYLAAPLFSVAERSFNKSLKTALSPYVEVFLPQEDGLLLSEVAARGGDIDTASEMVFQHDCEAVKKCDLLLIVLDGRAVDEGAAFELGVAFSLGKHCIALQTDSRRLIFGRNNPMINGAVRKVFLSESELLRWIASEFGRDASVGRGPGDAKHP